MAPKKRSQTPRHQVDNDIQHLSDRSQTSPGALQYPDPTLINTTTNTTNTTTTTARDRRRKLKVEPHSSNTVPGISRSPIDPVSPRSPIEGIVPGSHSRRESTSTMRTSSISLDGGAANCTPTGRISKAKKGKRVHACEFPGCGKVSSPRRQPPTSGPEGSTALDPRRPPS